MGTKLKLMKQRMMANKSIWNNINNLGYKLIVKLYFYKKATNELHHLFIEGLNKICVKSNQGIVNLFAVM